MTIKFANQGYSVAPGAPLSSISEVEQRVLVTSGRVWLTIAGEDEDFWLSAGDSISVPANRMVVVEADQTDSMIQVRDSVAALNLGNYGVAALINKISHKLSQAFA